MRHYAQHVVLGHRLRAARKAAGITQREASERLGCAQSFISNSERANRQVGLFELYDFAEVYGTTFEALAAPFTPEEQALIEELEAKQVHW